MQDPVPQSVAVGEIANSAVDDDSGPPPYCPLASSDVVDPRVCLRTMGVSSPAWARIRSFLTRTCRLHRIRHAETRGVARTLAGGTRRRSGAVSPGQDGSRVWLPAACDIGGGLGCVGPQGAGVVPRGDRITRAGGRWSGAAYRVARSRLAARPRTHAQGSELPTIRP